MMFILLKENTTNAKAPYGNYISTCRYSIFNNEDNLIGQYFIGATIDYFCYDEDGFGIATSIFSIDKWEHIIINQMDGEVVGNIVSHNEATIRLGKNEYTCTALSNSINEISFLVSNEMEQVFFKLIKKREKLESKVIIEYIGEIEVNTNNLLLVFASVYNIERLANAL
jgi:hypothetical protein